LRHSEQRRVLPEIPSSRLLLRLKLAAMLLALFQGYKTNDKKRNYSANTDKKYNDDYADRPFKYGSSFHSLATAEHRSNTDYKPLANPY
jgi:hypothetical protein